MKTSVRISSKSQGVLLTDLSPDHAVRIVNELIGATGIKRVIVEWEPEEEGDPYTRGDEPAMKDLQLDNIEVNLNYSGQTRYPEKDCEISDTGNKMGKVEDSSLIPPEPPLIPTDTQTAQDARDKEINQNPPTRLPEIDDEPGQPPEPYIFKEQAKISKKALGPFIDIAINNMGYHAQPDGDKIVICFGTTKVYTSMSDIVRLSDVKDERETTTLSLTKKFAVRRFKRWHIDNYKLSSTGPGSPGKD